MMKLTLKLNVWVHESLPPFNFKSDATCLKGMPNWDRY